MQLNRLFTNLIANAIHYTPRGGKVSITISREHHWVVFHIHDTGIGIASEDLDKLFDRFWRSDRSRSYWSGGSGLGLAIAQAIAHRHYGEITVTSQLGSGSCFRLFLPAQLE